MRRQLAIPWVAACAAIALCATALQAQSRDTARVRDHTTPATSDSARAAHPTSQVRIPIVKESGGEVMLPADSAMLARQQEGIAHADSMAAHAASEAGAASSAESRFAASEGARLDAVAAASRAHADSLAGIARERIDSLARTQAALQAQFNANAMRSRTLFHGSGWYIGVAGGATAPIGTLNNLGYRTGGDVTVPIGWQPPGHRLGLRLDLGYASLHGRSGPAIGLSNPVTIENPDPRVYTARLNARLLFPLNGSKTSDFYLVGGTGAYLFRHVGAGTALGSLLGYSTSPTGGAVTSDSKTLWGVSGGAGLQLGVGTSPSSIFVESRFVNVFSRGTRDAAFVQAYGNRSTQLRWVPIMLGVMIR